MEDLQELLNECQRAARATAGQGEVADYIPALAAADPEAFGMAIATVQGELYHVGDWEQPFSIQSISKLFTLLLALSHGDDTLWQGVGLEPSGTRFNSLFQLESDHGKPRNPFMNAGALVVTDRLQALTGDASGAVLDLLRTESGNPAIAVDPLVAASEAQTIDRNAALGHLIKSYGNLRNEVPVVLDHYIAHCSISASCRDLALVGRMLARHGLAADGTRRLTRSQAKRINAVMLTCGTYDEAGEFAYRVGLPAKSGVGGGMLAIVPGRAAICVRGPRLDPAGNSVAAMTALDHFTTATGWSIF
ncbi:MULTISPECIES: glutaminase [Streptomyces]|uniref:glutaminase n=1 Tax=Streptomyces TaxID=1883 RepID=UPI001FD296A5|nr:MULTISPECIES: glutaminase [Streptomyces]MCZ4098577.1 glutaminase [Streptomyces sp. H39-C1]